MIRLKREMEGLQAAAAVDANTAKGEVNDDRRQLEDAQPQLASARERYAPGHPDANADGYVAYPRMNPAEDMVDLMAANRGYDANVSAMSAVKDMIQRSIDLLK